VSSPSRRRDEVCDLEMWARVEGRRRRERREGLGREIFILVG